VEIAGITFGGREIILMAGPCAVEDARMLEATAQSARQAGARFLRGGVFKIRTSPESFAGLGLEGARLMRAAADRHGLKTVSEVVAPEQIAALRPYIDLFQVGSRNMQNTALLYALGDAGVPVLLKRGFGNSVAEWIEASRYVTSRGNPNVLLCERGIRTFESATRFTLDVAAIPVAKARTGLPVVVDPSHAAGVRDLVPALARAAVAAGADGLLIEVHPDPANARSDGAQSMLPDDLLALRRSLDPLAAALGRTLYTPDP